MYSQVSWEVHGLLPKNTSQSEHGSGGRKPQLACSVRRQFWGLAEQPESQETNAEKMRVTKV